MRAGQSLGRTSGPRLGPTVRTKTRATCAGQGWDLTTGPKLSAHKEARPARRP
jgi:hypothetical protein